jgi:hypothetical protein
MQRQAPAEQLAALYGQRWELENALDELKTHLRGPRVVLRSKTPDLVLQEKAPVPTKYLQIVHSIRQGQKVRQQVFGTLGRLDELKASGRLEALIRSGLRHCENFAVIDAHAAGETEAVRVLRIGPELVFGRLWKESGIQDVIGSLLEARRYDFDVERAIHLTVLHRLFASGSDRAAERWRENYLIAGTEALDLHHLYRAMAFLGQEIEPKGPKDFGFTALPKGFD